jgi:(R,R)-butanediol dehydrogenase/meso-butanediol dehydrogenase/diacetyl reductase
MAVALHAINQARVKKGDTVAVLGDGTIGLCSVLAAKAAGAKEIYMVAKHRGRGSLAEKMGAKAVIYSGEGDPIKKLQSLTGGIGADAAIECVGRPETPQLAMELTRRGGIAVIVGIFEKPGTVDFSTMTFTEKMMVGSSIYVYEGKAAIKLLAEKKIDPSPLISSTVPLQDAVETGFEALINDKETNVKVLLRV